MAKGHKQSDLQNLPGCACEFIEMVIRKMRYRKTVREEVQAELEGHFEDELKDCKTDEQREQKARQLIADFGDVKLLAVLLRRAKKRCRPLWRTVVVRTFQTVGVLVFCFILYTVWFISGKPTVRVDYLAQFNKMAQPQILDEDNAWPHYERAIELYVKPGVESDGMPAFRDYSKPAYRNYAALSEQEKREIEKWIRRNEEAWQKFKMGSSRLYCSREYTIDKGDMLLSVVLPHLAALRNLIIVGLWRSRMQIEKDETARALDDCLAVARAGGHWQGWGTIVEQLSGLTFSRVGYEGILHILATKDISAADMKQLQQQLSQIYPKGYPLMNLEGERLVFHDVVQHTFTDGGPGGGHLIPHRLSFIDDITGGGFDGMDGHIFGTAIGMIHAGRNDTIAKFNEVFGKQIEAAQMTPYERDAGKALHDEKIFLASSKYRYTLVNLFMPALDRACEYAYRIWALHEATVTVLALKRWRLEKGQYPMSLSELVAAGYIEQVPMDPYSDKPVVYKKTDDNFILYSLGPDFDDDGGVENPKDSQKRSQEGPGDEVFWPVPKPEAKQEQYGRST